MQQLGCQHHRQTQNAFLHIPCWNFLNTGRVGSVRPTCSWEYQLSVLFSGLTASPVPIPHPGLHQLPLKHEKPLLAQSCPEPGKSPTFLVCVMRLQEESVHCRTSCSLDYTHTISSPRGGAGAGGGEQVLSTSGSCPKEQLENHTEARSFPLQWSGLAVTLPMCHEPALQVPSGPTLLQDHAVLHIWGPSYLWMMKFWCRY